MGGSCLEALASARTLCRTLDSAPSPHARAQAIFAELHRAEGWPPRARDEIDAFGHWLSTRPPSISLKARTRQLIAALG
jgi:hypothetical protein